MFNSVTFVILLSACSEKVVWALKPVEHLYVSFSGTYKKHVFTAVVLDDDCLWLPVPEKVEDLHILFLTSNIEGTPSQKVGYHTELTFDVE